MEKQLKIISAHFHNIKTIDDFELAVNGKSVVIFGENADGKSSLIQSLEMQLMEHFKIPFMVKEGEKNGSVETVLEDNYGNKYVAKLKVWNTPTGRQKEEISIETSEGFKMNTKEAKDAFFGPRAVFDPDRFVFNQGSAKGQKENWKRVFEPLIEFDFTELDDRIEKNVEIRKTHGGVIKSTKTLFKEQGITIDDLDNIPQPVDTAKLAEELKKARQAVSDIAPFQKLVDTADQKRQEFKAEREDILKAIRHSKQVAKDKLQAEDAELERQLTEILNKQEALRGKIEAIDKLSVEKAPEGEEHLNVRMDNNNSNIEKFRKEVASATEALGKAATGDLPDVEKMEADYTQAVEKNARIKVLEGYVPKSKELRKAEAEYEGLTQKIEADRLLKKEQLAKVSAERLPSEFSLHLTDKEQIELRYKEDENSPELPFDPLCVPTSRMILAAVALGMELMKKSALRVICIHRAESLDRKTFEKVLKLVEEKGFQLFAEKVQDDVQLGYRVVSTIESDQTDEG